MWHTFVLILLTTTVATGHNKGTRNKADDRTSGSDRTAVMTIDSDRTGGKRDDSRRFVHPVCGVTVLAAKDLILANGITAEDFYFPCGGVTKTEGAALSRIGDR
jgi:hypothetical protein